MFLVLNLVKFDNYSVAGKSGLNLFFEYAIKAVIDCFQLLREKRFHIDK